MRVWLLALAMIAAPGGAQSTVCRTTGNVTTCDTMPPPTSKPDPVQQMVDNMQRSQRTAAEAQSNAIDSAMERRARAYAQVGELIAKGECAAANRLAQFYGHKDILKDTARACPVQ